MKQNQKFYYRFFRIQIFMSWLLIGTGFVFPIYIFTQYKFQAMPIYDGAGQTIGKFSYFAIAVPFGLLCVVMGILSIVAAKWCLEQLKKSS